MKPERFYAISITGTVRARKSPWIETLIGQLEEENKPSGLVRARGLKPIWQSVEDKNIVRARKSPWIETNKPTGLLITVGQGS